MNKKKKEKLDNFLYRLLFGVLILSGVTIVVGAISDKDNVMFTGIGVFAACMFCSIINNPPTHYDDEGGR